uniref:DUF4258 domain-containing protein n=1 Tax=Strongyloides venezuelensis TaxID=75913 RepID=A0A0K0EUX2_STRVS
MVNHCLEGLKSEIKMPNFNKMIRFYRNHELTEEKTVERMIERRKHDEAELANIEKREIKITTVETRTVMIVEPIRRSSRRSDQK